RYQRARGPNQSCRSRLALASRPLNCGHRRVPHFLWGGAHASVHGPFLMGPITFTQTPFEYFAGATLRQLGVQELNPAWNFVIGERAPALSHQLIRAEDLSRLQHDTGHHTLTPPGAWYREDRA